MESAKKARTESSMIQVRASQAPSKTLFSCEVNAEGTVSDLAAALALMLMPATVEPSSIVLICRGAVLKDLGAPLKVAAASGFAEDGHLAIVFMVRAAKAPAAPAAGAAPATAAPSAAAPAAASAAAAGPSSGGSKKKEVGYRQILLIRHGQCCHEGEHDELKALTAHGHKQAEATAAYLKALFDADKLSSQKALLHSTSRRARETAAKIPLQIPGIDVWNGDLLRETNPTANPLRAEDVFRKLFTEPPPGSDCIVVVAHNNIILYLLMRAAGVPIDRAAAAWNIFHLRHASITRIDVDGGGWKVVGVGMAGHIGHDRVTWNNIQGEDMSAFKGGEPERRKFSGRMLILVSHAAGENAPRSIEAAAKHISGFTSYMVSRTIQVASTAAAQQTGDAIAQMVKQPLQVMPESITEYPEAAFQQFFTPPEEHSRDTIILVAETSPVLYWLLRALQMNPEEAQLGRALYRIGQASVALVNIKSNGTAKVVAVGDTGFMPMDCL